MRQGVIDRYRDRLPVTVQTPVVSLLEGSTPLLEAPGLARELCDGRLRIYLKVEGLNPTGSFKDRGMTLALSRAVERGARAVICASTGNTAASAAAYAARAGIRCAVLLPHGMTAIGKLGQALMHGASVVAIRGNFDDALCMVRQISETQPVALVNSVNPDRIEGQKTAAFEICDELGAAPAYHVIPVGNAGNITAYWKGYREYQASGLVATRPRMLGFQAAGAAPIAEGHVFERPETIATAIRIGNPASWRQAEAARDESGGVIDKVTDGEILDAYRLLARVEGVFCEPASAATVAGLVKLCRENYFEGVAAPDNVVVCTLTGHGLKDPDTALSSGCEPVVVDAVLEEVLAAIGL
jgi:threonine synthase